MFSKSLRILTLFVVAQLGACGQDIAPSAARALTPKAITVYVHHLGWGEHYWHFKAVPGYDYATEMARRGHTSLVYDQLGYGASGRPPGNDSCHGGEADMLSQIVSQLRAGSYEAGMPTAIDGVSEVPVVFRVQNTNRSRVPCSTDGVGYEIRGHIVGPAASLIGVPTFERVALASHGVGALMTGPEAYSFNDVDALIVTAWASDLPSFSLFFGQEATALGVFCLQGGEPSNGDSGQDGYHYTPLTESAFRQLFFYDAEPAVVDKAVAMRQRGPCGEALSTTTAMTIDQAYLRAIGVPVLLVMGRNDALYRDPESAAGKEAALFAGSSDVTLEFLDNTGSALALERSAPQFRDVMSAWLAQRGF